jgi:hypothetical protein
MPASFGPTLRGRRRVGSTPRCPPGRFGFHPILVRRTRTRTARRWAASVSPIRAYVSSATRAATVRSAARSAIRRTAASVVSLRPTARAAGSAMPLPRTAVSRARAATSACLHFPSARRLGTSASCARPTPTAAASRSRAGSRSAAERIHARSAQVISTVRRVVNIAIRGSASAKSAARRTNARWVPPASPAFRTPTS